MMARAAQMKLVFDRANMRPSTTLNVSRTQYFLKYFQPNVNTRATLLIVSHTMLSRCALSQCGFLPGASPQARVQSKPAVSGKPHRMFMLCTA
jgi:hypothetical protein